MKSKTATPAVKLEFDALCNPTGPNNSWCHLIFPGDFVKTFGTRARVPISGTINDFPIRSSFSPMGGKFMLCINKEMQAGAKVKPGDTAHFVIERDDKPRTVTLPPALKKALAKNSRAKAIFDKLSYSHRKEYALWVAQPKQAETVERRLKKLIPLLIEKAR